jgi:hypothetical protein
MRHATSYDSRYASDPLHGLTSYGDAFQQDGPPPSAQFENRKTGDHPPSKPISNREKQIMEHYATVKAEYQAKTYLPPEVRSSILRANDAVVEALRDSSQLRGVRTYHRCLLYSRGDATWGMRLDYRIGGCSKWDDGIKSAERTLAAEMDNASAYERAAGDVSERGATPGETLAEVSTSIADQSTTAQEVADDVTTPGGKDGTWWDETPDWVKMLAYGTGALVVARVLLPPLFGTYLASRQDREI